MAVNHHTLSGQCPWSLRPVTVLSWTAIKLPVVIQKVAEIKGKTRLETQRRSHLALVEEHFVDTL